MTLEEKMIMYRARERITQTELARRCGLSLQTINNVENGLQKPSKTTLLKILFVVDSDQKGDGDNAES